MDIPTARSGDHHTCLVTTVTLSLLPTTSTPFDGSWHDDVRYFG